MITGTNQSKDRLLKLLLASIGCISLQTAVIAAVQVEDLKQATGSGLIVRAMEDTDTPNAVAVSLSGKCSFSRDGVAFTELTSQDVFSITQVSRRGKDSAATKAPLVLTQGVVIRTGEDSRVDIFFRRIGTTVRLQPNTEVRLEKMARRMEDGVPVMETLLDLRKGRIFTVVRSLVQGSRFEIRNAAGRSVVEGGGGNGRYIITADGTLVTEKGSATPLKIVRESGVTVIAPGMKFSAKDGKMLPLEVPEAVKLLIEFDELDALAEQVASPDEPTRKE